MIETVTKRYYIMPGNNAVPPSPPVPYSSDWFELPISVSAAFDNQTRRIMSLTPPVNSATQGSSAGRPWVSPTVPNDSAALQLIFPAFDKDQEVSGFFRMVVGTTYIGEAYLKVILRLMSADGATEKGLFNTLSGPRVYDGNTPYSRTIEGPLQPLEVSAGDFLIAEVGLYFAAGLGGSALVAGHGQFASQDIPYENDFLTDSGDTFRPWVELDLSIPPKPPARLVWTNAKAKYEIGVDRGVFYPLDGPGIAWNGLVQVDDSYVGGEIEPLYVDGVRYHNLPGGRNYQASITAYSFPEEFAPCQGDVSILDGLILTRQPRQRFGFSYRTMVGAHGDYKIHLIYNATATPTGRGYRTIDSSRSPNNPTWQIDAVPIQSLAPRPTAHFVLDSTLIERDRMDAIEGLLYGVKTRSPYLPSIGQITAIATDWDPQIILPYDDGFGIYQTVDGLGDLQESDIDGIYISLPTGNLAETDTRGLYRLMTEQT